MHCCTAFKDYNVCVCDDDELVSRVIDLVFTHCKLAECDMPQAPVGLPADVEDKFKPYDSMYELTLTTTDPDPSVLIRNFLKVVNSAMFAVKGYIYCVELTKAGLPHIHAMLFCTRKYIDSSKIKKLYGYRYSCSRVKNARHYYDYIGKEKENPEVQAYCDAHHIQQIVEFLK